jgi:tRNA-binding EMAP/Myf-like protein
MKYEKIAYNLPFIVGRVVHAGLAALLRKSVDVKTGKPNAIVVMKAEFIKEKKEAVVKFNLTPEELEKLKMQEFITEGMILAYEYKYQKMIKDMTYLGGEVEGALQFSDDVIFVIKMDNIVKVRAKKILHELKTSKTITPDYVKRIQTDIQTAIYFYFHNIIFEDEPIEEIMYDVIRKPSIKQKKKETQLEFIDRLKQWYDKPDDSSSAFHIERFPTPKISADDVINTVDKVSQEMLKAKTKEDYYQDFDKCHSYYGDVCPMYALCHEGGETKENLVLYTIRKPFHVSKENKGVGK